MVTTLAEDVNGTMVSTGDRVAVAGSLGQSVVIRIGTVSDVYQDKWNTWKVQVDWSEGKGRFLPSTKTNVGLDKVVVLLDYRAPVA